MHFKLLMTTLLGLGLTTFTHADFIGAKADISYWNFDGYSQNTARLPSTPAYEHSLDRDGAVQFSVSSEHPIPLIPNAKIKYVNVDSSSESTSAYTADIELSHTDYILYYEVLDNIVSADIGIGAANLSGDVQHRNATAVFHYDLDDYLPVVYAQAGVKLPFTGLSARAEAIYGGFDDTTLSDFQAELQYNFIENLVVNLGAKVGYRQMIVEDEHEQSPDLKMKFKGPYIGLDVHF